MNKIKKRIASIACAFAMMLSSVTTCSSAFGAETETDTAVETTTFTSETVTETSETTQAEQIEVLTEQAEVLTEQSISLYPDGEESEQVITLNGLSIMKNTVDLLMMIQFLPMLLQFLYSLRMTSLSPAMTVDSSRITTTLYLLR